MKYTLVCGKRGMMSVNSCVLPLGHSNGCVYETEEISQAKIIRTHRKYFESPGWDKSLPPSESNQEKRVDKLLEEDI